ASKKGEHMKVTTTAIAPALALAPPPAPAQSKQAPPKGKQPAPATPKGPAAPPAQPPQGGVIGGGGGGPRPPAHRSELKPFNESPGTSIALGITAPKGAGIVEIDDHGSKLDAFSDDKGQSLMEEGRVGPFPHITEDGSAAIVELEVRARPSPGASSV